MVDDCLEWGLVWAAGGWVILRHHTQHQTPSLSFKGPFFFSAHFLSFSFFLDPFLSLELSSLLSLFLS